MRIFHVKKVPINIHWSLIATLAFISTWQYFEAGIDSAASVVIVSLCLFGTVLLHELAHVFVAKDFGYDTESVTLYPFGGIARIEMPEEVPPVKEFYIALAGPLLNAVLAILFFSIAYFAGRNYAWLGLLNLAMFIFNMLPSYPMDGGRVMRSLLARRMNHGRATRISIIVSRVFATLYFIGGLALGSPMLSIIGAYLLYLLFFRINTKREVKNRNVLSVAVT